MIHPTRMYASVMRMLRHRNAALAAAALALLIAATLPPLPLARNVFTHLVVLDITQSMYVVDQQIDGRPVSRLELARQGLIRAVAQLPCGSQIGLGIFSSRRTLLLLSPVEVCRNRAELDNAIMQIDARMAWEEASVIARGVYSATDVAVELAQRPSLIFMSDGQESPPMATIPEFDRPKNRVKGVLVGVGGDTAMPIPRLDKDARQIGWWRAADVVQRPTPAGFGVDQEHLSSLHAEHLQGLAEVTGLRYARMTSASSLLTILSAPDLQRSLVVPTDLRHIPAALAALLLALHFLPALAALRKHMRSLIRR